MVEAVVWDIGNIFAYWEPEAYYDRLIGRERREAFFAMHRELQVLPTVSLIQGNVYDPMFLARHFAGCDAVILGCTEIPLIIDDGNAPLPTLDSTRLLARAALRRAVGHG